MNELYYILSTTVLLLLSVIEVAMLARAVLSWIMPDGEGFLVDMVYILTEPLILPFRKLFERKGWFQDSPLDIAYFCAVISLMIITTVVSIF